MNDYEHGDLLDMLDSLNQDVPPMPEDFHAGWVRRLEDDMEDKKQKKPIRKTLIRVLSAAAAVVFVVGGVIAAQNTGEKALFAEPQMATRGMAGDGMPAPAVMEEAAEYEDAAYDSDAGGVYGANSMNTAAIPQERMIVRSAGLTLGAERYDDSLAALRALCETAGGWVASSSESASSSGLRTCYLTLRVPAEALDAFLSGTNDLGRVIRRSESAEDVTESYFETRARLETQEALMDRLMALVGSAGSLSDLLALEEQMASTQYQIDRLQSSLNSTERRVNYATVDVTLREENSSAGIGDGELSLGQRLLRALKAGGEAFLQFAEGAIIFLTAALPFIAVVAAVWLLVRFIRKKVRQRRES